jgi:hypothetical protein
MHEALLPMQHSLPTMQQYCIGQLPPTDLHLQGVGKVEARCRYAHPDASRLDLRRGLVLF